MLPPFPPPPEPIAAAAACPRRRSMITARPAQHCVPLCSLRKEDGVALPSGRCQLFAAPSAPGFAHVSGTAVSPRSEPRHSWHVSASRRDSHRAVLWEPSSGARGQPRGQTCIPRHLARAAGGAAQGHLRSSSLGLKARGWKEKEEDVTGGESGEEFQWPEGEGDADFDEEGEDEEEGRQWQEARRIRDAGGIRLSPREARGGVASSPSISDAVRELLEARGIRVEQLELKGVLLPESAAIVQERLDFLEALGLDPGLVVAQWPPLLGCSVAKNFLPVLAYLEGVPIKKAELPGLVRAYPRVLACSVVRDLAPRLAFLEGLGVRQQDLGGVLLAYPELLGLPLEGTLSTSVAYLVGIGVRPRSIGPMVVQQPTILGTPVAASLLPKVTFLRSLGLAAPAVAQLLERSPFLLALDLEAQMMCAAAAMEAVGVARAYLGPAVQEFPQILGLVDIDERLGRVVGWLRERVGVEPQSVPGMLVGTPQLLALDLGRAEEKLAFLGQWGFSHAQVAHMVQQRPFLLGLDIAKSLGPKLSYLLDESRRSAEEVAGCAYVLLLPMADIREREETLRQLRMRKSLQWTFMCTDSEFKMRVEGELSNPQSL